MDITDKCNVSPILAASYANNWNTVSALFKLDVKTNHINSYDKKCILHNLSNCTEIDLVVAIIKATKELVNLQYVGSMLTSNIFLEI